MTWFKVDDSLHSHMKAIRAGEAAMGLWVLAGSWSADQLTDGWIPRRIARRLSPRADKLAKNLESVGLWTPDWRENEPGWVFHSWSDYQPTRADVEARRKADADRRARWRKARQEAKSAGQSTSESRQESQQESRDESRRDTGRAARGVSVLPDPTRPDPVSSYEDTNNPHLPSVGVGGSGGEAQPAAPKAARAPRGPNPKGTRLPGDFTVTAEMARWARESVPDVDIQSETARFCDHWRAKSGKDATKRDWPATWRNWMRKAAEIQQDRARNGARRNGTRPSGMTLKDERIARIAALDLSSEEEPPW